MNLANTHKVEMNSKGQVRRSFSPIRLIGNLLIASGLLLLIGIGGWQGYSWWSNQQYLAGFNERNNDDAQTQAGLIVDGTPLPTSTPLPPAPPPNLNPGGDVSIYQPRMTNARTDNSPPIRIRIPSVAIDASVVPVTWYMIPSKDGAAAKSEWQVADYAVGHHAGSANPGQIGNVVLSGHVDYRGEVFRNLQDVKKGDTVTLDTENGQYVYIVTSMVIVKEEGVPEEQKRANAAYMNPTPDQTVTMITCWPYGVDDHRLIVIAKPYQSSQSANSEYFVR